MTPDAKASMEKEWKEVIKNHTQKQKGKESPLCCIDGHPAHIQKYEYISENIRESSLKCGHKYKYILVNVRKSNLKCRNYQAQMKELYTNFQRRSMKWEWGQKI